MKVAPTRDHSNIIKTVRFNLGEKVAPIRKHSSSSCSNKIVRFNVGGIIYDVERSLIEEHPHTMLARYVSDVWCRDDEEVTSYKNIKPLFIGRDGERFQFCLDYMRDGRVVDLPPTVSKEALLQDLAYFGFHNVDPALLSHGNQIDSYVRDIEAERELLYLVKHLLIRYKRNETRSLQLYIHQAKLKDLRLKDRNGVILKKQIRDRFDRVLDRFALKTNEVFVHKDVVSIRFVHVDQ